MPTPRRMDGHRPEVSSALMLTFNEQYPVGALVCVVKDDGTIERTRVRRPAWILGHGAVVVGLEGISGGYSLDRVIPVAGAEP